MSEPTIRRVTTLTAAQIDDLAEIVLDGVADGAGFGFMDGVTRERARLFWRGVADGLAQNDRALLVAEDDHGVCGTVQLRFAQPDNQPHRGDVAKMLVHRRARRRGLGAALMTALVEVAREEGRTLLVLDTATGSAADRLYTRLGWQRVGEVPDYALDPDGSMCATTFFYLRVPTG
jgi:ribosomal protein S18 acetylase RimI-like enzyme